MCFKRDTARDSDGHIGASIAQNDLFTIEWVQDNGHSVTLQNSQVQAAKVYTAVFKLESCGNMLDALCGCTLPADAADEAQGRYSVWPRHDVAAAEEIQHKKTTSQN